MNFFQVRSYVNYLIKSRHAKGYGLHSPFVFNLVRDVFYSKHSYYSFEEIKELKAELISSKKEIKMVDYGAGSMTFKSKERAVSDLVRNSSIAPKYGELLFRIIQTSKPDNILELGTSIGISTLYLALADKKRTVLTIEGCPETAHVAKDVFAKMNCINVDQIVGQFEDVLPGVVSQYDKLDFVFFDGNHQKQATLDYFNTCLPKAGNNSVFVFDDIHWSKGMEEAWEIICKHPRVTVSIDLFQLGVVFFRRECQKQHFIVRY